MLTKRMATTLFAETRLLVVLEINHYNLFNRSAKSTNLHIAIDITKDLWLSQVSSTRRKYSASLYNKV